MTRVDGSLLVLGVGNVLLRDDGVGVRAVVALRGAAERGELELPRGTSLVDGGTLGADLLSLLDEVRALVLVDAVAGEGPPGMVTVTRGREITRRREGRLALDRVGIDALLDAATVAGTLPDAVSLVGVVPAEIDVGLELSEVVRAALPGAIEVITQELYRLDAITSPATGTVPSGHVATGAMA